ncbi:hypothetical protein GCM10011504_30210 [Siccirubricoccus deserti]|uniref:Uncharacterized protein n=1 Tax=Siccirubricoccus deserti TaxID=2013562 RepID=A0A9X0R0I2_9PROT|nr:hypothetical protein [Siccirubricoccus deserti]MBC4016522.1 hypothetical protein [Siccirubricoccus deserti]GGC49757.1 hypothetical protein GCM10011504_30210 [Siccirubricoccus deserti]
MKLHTPIAASLGLSAWAGPLSLGLVTGAGAMLLPGAVLFVAGLAGVLGAGISVAEARRHSEAGAPTLPFGGV